MLDIIQRTHNYHVIWLCKHIAQCQVSFKQTLRKKKHFGSH